MASETSSGGSQGRPGAEKGRRRVSEPLAGTRQAGPYLANGGSDGEL
jgi:hypothetical protein